MLTGRTIVKCTEGQVRERRVGNDQQSSDPICGELRQRGPNQAIAKRLEHGQHLRSLDTSAAHQVAREPNTGHEVLGRDGARDRPDAVACHDENQQAIGKDEILEQRLRSEKHTSELQSLAYLVCRLLLEKKKKKKKKKKKQKKKKKKQKKKKKKNEINLSKKEIYTRCTKDY